MTRLPPLLLLTACTEYAVIPAAVSGGADTGTSVHALPPPGRSPWTMAQECDGVDAAAEGASPTATCDMVGFAAWDFKVEWEAATVIGAFPMVLPNPAGHSDVAESRLAAGFLFLDGDGGAERDWFPTRAHDDTNPVAYARLPTGEPMATWREPGSAGADVTRWWSAADGSVVSSVPAGDLGGTVRWLDIDEDGSPETVGHNLSVAADGTTIALVEGRVSYDTAMTANGDFNADGRVEIASTHGIWDALTGAVTPWSGLSGHTFQAAPVLLDGEVAFLGTDGQAAFRANPDGEVVWRLTLPENDQGIAVGDVDGDGVPELAVNTTGEIVLLDANGTQLWSVPSRPAEAGAVVMADLDADGAHEVIAYGNTGLRILAGADGTVLAEDSTIYNGNTYGSPAIADIDGDGSADIVVVGQRREDAVWVVRAYGAAEGRWARTRPVWNELDYDVTTVQDDGKLAVWPIPSWESYNSFRAQPAHDGPHPDLTVAATDLCCDSDTVYLAVQPSNLGSVAALAGATITLSTNDGTGWRAVASKVLADGIGARRSLAGLVFEIPRSDWGNLQVIQITGADGDECDFVNDRVQVQLECPEP